MATSEIARTDYAHEITTTYADNQGRSMEFVTEDEYDARRLQWCGEFVSRDDAMMLLPLVGEYGQFDPARVAEVLTEWLPQSATVAIAREYSVCIYVQDAGEEAECARHELRAALRADECDFMDNGTLRLWWD